jgi:hypothetical protein
LCWQHRIGNKPEGGVVAGGRQMISPTANMDDFEGLIGLGTLEAMLLLQSV